MMNKNSIVEVKVAYAVQDGYGIDSSPNWEALPKYAEKSMTYRLNWDADERALAALRGKIKPGFRIASVERKSSLVTDVFRRKMNLSPNAMFIHLMNRAPVAA